MDDYGHKFKSSIIQDWKDKYIDYESFITCITDINNSSKKLTSEEVDKTMRDMLDKELKKIYLFFIGIERELYIKINTRLYSRNKYVDFNGNDIKSELIELDKIIDYSYSISRYIKDNMEAFSHLIDLIDSSLPRYGINIKFDYIQNKMESKGSDIVYIFKFKMINEVSALCDDMRDELMCYYQDIPDNMNEIINNNKESINDTDNNINSINDNANALLKKDQDYEFSNLDIDAINQKIIEKLDKVDKCYHSINKIDNEWTRILKFCQYYIDSTIKNKNDNNNNNDDNASKKSIEISSMLSSMSKTNKWNVNLTLIQKWYMALCSSLIYSNAYRAISEDLKYSKTFVVFIIGATPIGAIISMIVTNYWLISSYKMPMLLSSGLSVLGNILYILGIGIDNIYILSVSRLLIGFALNTRVHRRYLSDFIPKRKLGKYMLYLKLSYLSGIACGPLLTMIMSIFKEYGNRKSILPFTHYTSPTWACSVGAIILFILIIIFYTEPLRPSFQALRTSSNDDRKLSSGNSALLDSSMTQNESETFNKLNSKLSEFNDESNYSDTNQVSSYIDYLIKRELGKYGTVQKSCICVIIQVFFSSLLFMLIICIIPLISNETLLKDGMNILQVDKMAALSLTMPLLILIPLYFVNYFFISPKLDLRIYMLLLSLIISALTLGAMFYTKKLFELSVFTFFILNISYIFQDTNIYFFTKMVTSTYKLTCLMADTFVQLIIYVGHIVGCYIILMAGLVKDKQNKFAVFFKWMLFTQTIIFFILLLFQIVFFKSFKDTAIMRLLREKEVRKIRRTEF